MARRRLTIAPLAAHDLTALWRHISEVASVVVADRLIENIADDIESIVAHPFLGRARPDIRIGIRSLHSAPYTIFYSLTERACEIVRVLHERQDAQEEL